MKANEIPKRIYSIPTEGGFYLTAIKPEPPFADGIEYTQTDAFIEKACNWLEQTLSPYIPYCDIDIDLAIEDFKKYMEGD